MDFGDSGELYTIKNQFYTAQHVKVKEYSLDQFSEENQLKVVEFQIRSTIALEQDASTLIDESKVNFPDNESFFQLLSAWNDLHSFGTDDSPYFEDINDPTSELQAVLTALYLVKFMKDIESATKLLEKYISNSNILKVSELEPHLVLMQLYLAKGNLKSARQLFDSFKSFPDSARDNIIYQVLESWLHSIQGETDNINNSYYFYDEILSGGLDEDEVAKYRVLNTLLVLTIQLKHYPEAGELLDQIKALGVKEDANFLANQIALNYQLGKGNENQELFTSLSGLNPDHAYLVDHEEKNTKFTEIVAKYRA